MAPGLLSQELKPEVLLLAHTEAHLRESLARLPDYTCLETFERYHKAAGKGQVLKPLDTIRLEVLYSGSKEWYGSPGSSEFKDEDPTAFISNGLIGNGAFALLLKSVFVDGNALIAYSGQEELAGRLAARFDFALSPTVSGYTVSSSGISAVVGLKGSAWIDPESLDVIRLVSHADQIPPSSPVMEQTTILEFARTRVGERDVMLPQAGEFSMRSLFGTESRDVIEFTHCRSFRAESAIRFAEPVEAPTAEGRALRATGGEKLPVGLEIAVALTAPVGEDAAVGAAIEGVVTADVKNGRKTAMPAGAPLHGRIRSLERHNESGGYFAIGLEFTEIEINGARARFYADMVRADQITGLEYLLTSHSSSQIAGLGSEISSERVSIPDLPGVGSFFLRRDRLETSQRLQDRLENTLSR